MKLLSFLTISALLLIASCQTSNLKTAADYLEAANANLDQKDYVAAINNATHSIERDPTNPEAWNTRAYAYYFSEDFERAIADYTETLRLEPEMGVAYVLRAQAYKMIGENDKAAADMETIERLIETQRANQIIQHN